MSAILMTPSEPEKKFAFERSGAANMPPANNVEFFTKDLLLWLLFFKFFGFIKRVFGMYKY
jgi:hypothetical protein